MPKSALPGSLNQLLSEFDKARLLHLLELRPDLVREDLPVPDPVSLAAKAALVPSVSACLLELDLFQQLLVQALAAAPEPVTIPRLATLLGNIPTEDVRRGLVELEERALAAARGDAVWVLGSIRDMALPGLGPRAQTLATACSVEQLLPIATVLGVAPKSRRKGDVVAALCAALGDPGRLAPLVASAPGGTEELVSRLFTHPVVAAPYTSYSPRAAATSPTQWLANHGLLLPLSWGQVVMPREVAIALRGGQLFREVPTSPPALLGVPVDPSALDPGAATHALGTLGELARVLDLLAAAPAAELATGGIGVRELRRLGKRLGLEESIVARRLELADAMGLLGRDPVARTVLPATSYDRWLEEDPAGRWQAAVTGWRAAPRSLSAATTLDPDTGKPRPALVGARGSYAPALRRALLTALAGAAGSVPLESLHRRLRFDRPALCAGTDDELPELAALLVEAEELGLVAGGALTGIGQLVAAGAVETAAAAVGGYGPAASDRLLISGDLTALAAGTLPNVVSGELALIADVISRDLATTYRFSEASLRRGFDAGRTSEQILDFLDRHAERGVPQALSYLVGDLGRRHGQLRVGDAVGYVRCADPALATELEHSRSLSRLGLRHLGGGVLVATVGTEELLAALRAAGQLPVAEDTTGTVVPTQSAPRRAPARRSAAPAAAAPGPGWARAAGNGIESRDGYCPACGTVHGDDDEDGDLDGSNDGTPRPTDVARNPSAIARLLRLADEEDFAVRLSLRNDRGRTTEQTAAVSVTGTRLHLFLPDGRERSVPVHQVLWARVLTDREEEVAFGG